MPEKTEVYRLCFYLTLPNRWTPAYGRLQKTQDYKIRLGREYTRPNGGRQEHAARPDPL